MKNEFLIKKIGSNRMIDQINEFGLMRKLPDPGGPLHF